MLSKLMGSLRQAQDSETLKQNIIDIQNEYEKLVKAVGGDPKEVYKKRKQRMEGGVQAPEAPVQYKSPKAQSLAEEFGL